MPEAKYGLLLAAAIVCSACGPTQRGHLDDDRPPRRAMIEGGNASYPTCTPRQIAGIADALTMVRTSTDACVVTKSGQLYCWSDTGEPARVDGVGDDVIQYLELGYRSYTLHEDGSVRSWAHGEAPSLSFRRPGIVEIATQIDDTILARTTAGPLLAWNHRRRGKLEEIADVPTPIHAFVPVIYDPYPDRGGTSALTSRPPYVVIAGPERRLYSSPHIAGDVYPRSLTNLVAIQPETFDSLASGCALFDDHSTRCWDTNTLGRSELQRLAGLGPVESLHGIMGALCGLRGDGILACQPHECPTPPFDDIEFITGGTTGACVIRSDGSVWCWGRPGSLGTTPSSGSSP